MNLRSRFFKKPWQHRDEQLRAQAVREDQDAELKAELPRMAQSDESAVVRLAALQRLNAEPFWLDARLRETAPELIKAADQALTREVLRSDKPELNEARLEWLALVKDGEVLRRIAASSPSQALRRSALLQISAQGFLGDCYVSEASDELAAQLLERIDQMSTLERVVQQARKSGHKSSKQRAQAAAERLEALKIAAGQATPGQSASERLVQLAENLARGRGQVGDLAVQLAELQAEWDSSSEHPAPLALRFAGAIRIIENTLRQRDAATLEASLEAEAAAEDEAQPVPGEQASVAPALAAAADFLRRALASAGPGLDVRELLAHWDRAWNMLPQAGAAELALKEEMLPLLRDLQARMQKQSQARLAQESDTKSAPAPRLSLQPQLDRVAELLEAGELSAVHELLHKLRRDFDRQPPRQRDAADSGRLQRMEGRLKEMRDWQHWSNNQARELLIAQIEQLPGSGQHPDAIMASLKQARAEWSRLEALELLPGDQRRNAAPPGQWRQFEAACKLAYETSKPFLDKREQLLKDNLKTLREFIRAGQQAAASEDSEIATLLGFQRKAREAIRRMDDIPAKARAASAAGLRELMSQLSASLETRFEQIESTKRRLIAEASSLVEEKDRKAAVDKAKSLQAQWQKAGSGRRKTEQELWKAFREPIDALFQQLKGEQDQRRQAENAARAELQARCEEVEALSELPEPELDQARTRLQALRADWRAQPQRPDNLNRRFERAEQRFEQRLREQRIRQQQGAELQVQQLAELVQQLWQARCAGDNGDLSAPLAQHAGIDGIGAELLEMAAQLASPDCAVESLRARSQSNAEAARLIAIELEFLAGLESPAADQALRMDHQVQRLARRLGEREQRPDLASELEQLVQRWYRSLPQPAECYAELLPRVAAARLTLRGMAGL